MTKNYEKFKKIPGNRDVSENHVKTLMASITMRNLLKYRPILINENWEVIDGQHRLEAAKRLELPIHYTLYEKLEHDDIVILNTHTKEWSIEDYFKMHLTKQNDNYIKLRNFTDKHKISVKACLSIFQGPKNHSVLKNFKSGLFKFPDNEIYEIEEKVMHIKQIIQLVAQYSLHSTSIFTSKPLFWCSLYQFFCIEGVNIEIFMKRAVQKASLFRAMSTKRDYINFFTEIYNFNNRYPIEQKS